MKIKISEGIFREKYFSKSLGEYWLSIPRPNSGEVEATICFHDNQREWGCDPIHICQIPRWNPDGSGQELENALDFLNSLSTPPHEYEDWEEYLRLTSQYPPEYAEENFPKEWDEFKEDEFNNSKSLFETAIILAGLGKTSNLMDFEDIGYFLEDIGGKVDIDVEWIP